MDFIGIFFVLVLTTQLGYALVDIFLQKTFSPLFKYALGFGVGYGAVAFLLVGLQLLKIVWSWPIIFAFMSFLAIFHFAFKQFGPVSFKLSLKGNWLIKILILLLLAFVLFEATLRPLSSWDGWASWEMRSKAISIDKKVSVEQFQYLQTEYPLVVPLYNAFSYGAIGSQNDRAILIISWYFYLLIGVLSLEFLSKKTNGQFAIFFTFLILSTQNLIRHGGRYEGGLADIIMSYFILCSVVLLSTYIVKKKLNILILLSVFLGIAANIKNEGIFFSLIAVSVTLYYMFKFKQKKKIYILFLYFMPVIFWLLFKTFEPLPVGILTIKPQISLQIAIHLIVVEFQQYLNIQNWNLGWLFITASIGYLSIKKKINGVLMVLVILEISYSIIFIFSKVDPVEHASGVLDRLLLHIFPSLVVFVSIGLYPYCKNNRLLKQFGLV